MEFKLHSESFHIRLTAKDCCTCDSRACPPPIAIQPYPAHPANPYDEIGQAHNAALAALTQKFGGSEPTYADIVAATIDYLRQYPFVNPLLADGLTHDTGTLNDLFKPWNLHANRFPYAPKFPADLNIALDKFWSRLKAAGIPVQEIGEGMLHYTHGRMNGQQLIDKFKQLEVTALGSTLNEEDRAGFLAIAAVARYSIAYWANIPATSKREGGPVDADIEGAAAGVAGGALGGAALGLGVGAVGGAVICGVAGGVLGSLTYCLGTAIRFLVGG
jgi:hypothetical protein